MRRPDATDDAGSLVDDVAAVMGDGETVIDDAEAVIDEVAKVIDNAKTVVDDVAAVIDNAETVIDDVAVVTDDPETVIDDFQHRERGGVHLQSSSGRRGRSLGRPRRGPCCGEPPALKPAKAGNVAR